MSALHSLITLYEKQFQLAALRSCDGDRVTTSVTPTGWIHVSLDPPEVETSFESEQPTAVGGSIGTSRQISTRTSATLSNGSLIDSPPLSSFSGEEVGVVKKSFGSPRATPPPLPGKAVHNQIWKGLVLLASDPCPKVAEHAQCVVHSVHDKVLTILIVCVFHIPLHTYCS